MFNLQEILIQFNTYLAEKNNDVVWDEEPPTIEDMLDMVDEKLEPMQEKVLVDFFGKDPKNIFFNLKNYAFLALGKGSGKDFIAVRLVVWAVAVLNCMHNPRKQFDISDDATIDVINVSKTNDQASNIFFKRVIKYIKNHPWFNERFKIVEGNKFITDNDKPVLKIAESKKIIEFPDKGILLVCANAQYGNYEGYSPIISVIDELGNFYKAPEGVVSPQDGIRVFDTLETSAKTRYTNKFKIIALSWIRSEDDCMVTLMDQYKGRDDTLTYELPSWKVRPHLYSKKMVKIVYKNKVYEVPENIADDFKRNTDTKLRMYGSFRLASKDDFFDISTIDDIRTGDWLIKTEDYVQGIRIKKRIVEFNPKFKKVPLIIHVDLGEINCLSVMSVGYGWIDGNMRGLVVLNSLGWKPTDDYLVSINNVLDIILQIAEFGKVVYVQYDDWNSSTSIETLEDRRINTGKHTVSRQDYLILRNSIKDRKILIGDVDYDIDSQLSGVKDLGNKIDVKKGYYKDGLDTLAGLLYLVRSLDKVDLLNVSQARKRLESKQLKIKSGLDEFLARYGG